MGNSSSVNFTLLNEAINRYIPIPLLFLGIIGNIFNILVFSRRVFRQNICVNYFLASTVFDSFAIIVGLLPRFLNGFGYDLSQTSPILCKLRFFITYFSGSTAGWFIGLACVERYLSSSTDAHRRQLITMKRAYLSMLFVIVFGFFVYGEQFYCIDINQNLFGAPQSCYQLKLNIACQIADSLLQFLFEMLSPAVMMIVFGLLTLRNVRQTHRRIHTVQPVNTSMPPVNTAGISHRSAPEQQTNIRVGRSKQTSLPRIDRAAYKRDRQLVTMLLVQIIVFVISTFPISAYKLYSIATIYTTKTVLRKSIENTIFNLAVICLFINNSITFYLYTLSGRVFRKELIEILRFS